MITSLNIQIIIEGFVPDNRSSLFPPNGESEPQSTSFLGVVLSFIHISLTLFPRRGSRNISDIPGRFTKITTLVAMDEKERCFFFSPVHHTGL
jgi:hypothetical protein